MIFDRVDIREKGTVIRMSREEFLAMPLDRRIRVILARDLEFFLGDQPVDRREALRSLR